MGVHTTKDQRGDDYRQVQSKPISQARKINPRNNNSSVNGVHIPIMQNVATAR